MGGPPTRCGTCEDLLSKLSAASDRSFRVTSDLASAAQSGENGLALDLLASLRAHRAECDLIRKVLEEHWANCRKGPLAAAG
jgi:hypothetical protein